jgi:hypothetical protein
MNEFLPSRYVEVIHRLGLGIEPIDAQGSRRLGHELQVRDDKAHLGSSRPPVERHASNLYALRYQEGVTTPIDLRFFDSTERFYTPEYDRRRIVPRRLRIPILSLADVETEEQVDKKSFTRRIRRPVFFPGATYASDSTATSLRGRVMRNGKPLRWARVVATLAGEAVLAGRAQGDDRGEFLLIINSQVTAGSALPNPLNIEVSVFGPATTPIPNPASLPEIDPLWDLPLESLAAPGTSVDQVASGEQLPPDYTANATRVVEFTLGRCLSNVPDFVIT